MTRLSVPVPLRWADLDAYGHVNNVEVLRLLEEARIAAFWRHPEEEGGSAPTAVLDAGPTATTHTVVARTEVEYLRPIAYQRDPVVIEMWIGHLGGASIDICYRLLVGATTEVHVQAISTLVVVDAATGAPRRISQHERAAWEPYVEDLIELRRPRR